MSGRHILRPLDIDSSFLHESESLKPSSGLHSALSLLRPHTTHGRVGATIDWVEDNRSADRSCIYETVRRPPLISTYAAVTITSTLVHLTKASVLAEAAAEAPVMARWVSFNLDTSSATTGKRACLAVFYVG